MMNYNAMLSGLRDLVDNPTPRVPVLLCLDTSGSMMGAPIHELNLGVQQYMAEMKSDDLTRCSAETAVVSFDDSADCVADFDTADRLGTGDGGRRNDLHGRGAVPRPLSAGKAQSAVQGDRSGLLPAYSGRDERRTPQWRPKGVGGNNGAHP